MKRSLPWVLAFVLFAATPIFPKDGLWKVSLVTLAAANTADAATSWGKPEANPLLGSRFGMRGVAIKSGLFTGAVLAERKAQHKRWLTVLNFALSGALAAVAVHNTR